MRTMVAALVAAAGLLGMARADVSSAPPAETQKVPQSIWQVAPDGAATHLQSTFLCPTDLSGFRQAKLTAYDQAGFDVSCGLTGRDGWITVYLTRLGDSSLDAAFADAKEQLVQHMPDAVPLADADQKTFARSFRHLVYSQKSGAQWSGIWMTEFSGWMFEFRATYKPAAEQEVFDAMAELSRRAEATAAAHLALCAKSAPVTRDGVPVTDKTVIEKAMMMVSLLGAVDPKPDQASEKPIQWCADSTTGPLPAVFWHAVHADGSDAVADRVTPASVEVPPVLTSAPNAMAALFSDGKEGNNGPQWFVSLKLGNKTWFFAIYKGRPSSAALGQILSDIANHKAKAIGGYSVDGKNVTISMPEK